MGRVTDWFGNRLAAIRSWFDKLSDRSGYDLFYFEDVLPEEFAAINERRRRQDPKRDDVARARESPDSGGFDGSPWGKPRREFTKAEAGAEKESDVRRRSPDPEHLFQKGRYGSYRKDEGNGGNDGGNGGGGIDPTKPDRLKMRPRPVPCDATGLACSGGGVRSAATCLGAVQALQANRRLGSIDYLSTVSGGGYLGACLSAAMSRKGGYEFPFAADVCDSPAVAHLRNYSNYLLPRGRSGLRNVSEAAVVILRGLLANAVIVVAIILLLAALTLGAEPLWGSAGNPMLFTAAFLAIALFLWALLRSLEASNRWAGDTSGLMLWVSRLLFVAALATTFIALQPLAIEALAAFREMDRSQSFWRWLQGVGAALVAFAGGVSAFAGGLGRFLQKSRRASGFRILLQRAASKLAIVVAGAVVPLALWLLYLWLVVIARDGALPSTSIEQLLIDYSPLPDESARRRTVYLHAGAIMFAVSMALTANSYSLHRLYRDRLSKAFLFDRPDPAAPEPNWLDDLKLSDLTDTWAPYHIINAAMNVQGSTEANRRGRNADFFMFSSKFVGSDLTLYARSGGGNIATLRMEDEDPRLDLATAMAISGAAVSANMGTATIRALSPTLALLNIRLGYWMRNPRHLAGRSKIRSRIGSVSRRAFEKLFLLREMMNLHDEHSADLFLTDGGHIENLGLYELLKRGCRLIVVIDAEADPTMSFGSLLRVERYARIDLGVRIILPWEEVADCARKVEADLLAGHRTCNFGPHCAVGRILYQDGVEGVLVYFKSSLTGDEKDYLLDYKVRNSDFPHETTGDQFFSEEQFEMYRALGFHMVDGFFSRTDDFACNTKWNDGADQARLRDLVDQLLPPRRSPG